MHNQIHSDHVSNEIRKALVEELRAEGLTREQQDTLMQEVGDALLQRVTAVLLRKLPPTALLELAENDVDGTKAAEETMRMISEHVPDAEHIIKTEIQEGLRAYHAYLDKAGT